MEILRSLGLPQDDRPWLPFADRRGRAGRHVQKSVLGRKIVACVSGWPIIGFFGGSFAKRTIAQAPCCPAGAVWLLHFRASSVMGRLIHRLGKTAPASNRTSLEMPA